MKVLIVLSALCALAACSPVAPVLLSKVQVAPAQVTVVKEPYVVTETEHVVRNVPVPYRAVAYTAPHVVPGPVITPVVHHAPVVHTPVVHHAPLVHAPVVHHAPLAYSVNAPYHGHSIVL